MVTKALIYCRVSSIRQVTDGHGNDSQEKRCRDLAAGGNYPVAKVFPDNGVSGGLFERPAMKELLQYIDTHAHEQFVVIFDDLARFARDVGVHIKLKAEFNSRGVKLLCLNFNFDDSPESEYAELVLAAGNQYQRQSNRRQVFQKMKARLERGYWAFGPPRGLDNVRDVVHGKILVPEEPFATVFKKAIESFAVGQLVTPDQVREFIGREYKKIGIGKSPSLSTVQQLLRNPLYAGYLEYQQWEIPFMKAQHEGFISFETYKTVQERLKRRTKPWKRRDYSFDFPLRPHVLCSGCGKPMTGSWNKGRSARYPNYFCRIKGCKYNWKTVSKSKLEGEFETLLGSVKPPEEVIDLAKEVLQERWNFRLESYTAQRAAWQGELREVKEGIDKYMLRIRKTNDEEMVEIYEQEIKDLRVTKEQLQKNLGKQTYTAKEFGTATDKIFETLKNPMGMWKSDVYSDKKTVLGMYFEDNLQYDYNSGFGTVSLAYPIKLINQVGSAKSGDVEMSGSEPESVKT